MRYEYDGNHRPTKYCLSCLLNVIVVNDLMLFAQNLKGWSIQISQI